MKKLVLVFEKLLNIHLVKDVGQIPYLLGKHFGFDASIACMNIDTYAHAKTTVKGLKLEFTNFGSYLYLICNARKINVCMLFHIRAKSIYQGLIYKLLNPHGFLYIKSDLKDSVVPLVAKGKRGVLAQTYNRLLYNCFCRIVDLVSFETMAVFKAITSIADHKKMYLPNGFDVTLPQSLGVHPKDVAEKQDIILCVARHGTEQKNSELLLQALEKIDDLGSWKFIFAGEASQEFRNHCENFLKSNPQHVGKVILTGEISDRKPLFELYSQAKVFCLPSRWESWGLVCTEALYFGCALVMTREVVSAPDLTDNGRAGLLAGNENAVEWAEVLQNLMHDPKLVEHYSNQGRAHFNALFSWPDALAPLAQRLLSNQQQSAGEIAG